MMAKIKLTKRHIDNIDHNGKDEHYWDTELAGFGLRIKPSGVKTYLIQYRSGGRTRKHTLGKHGILTPDQARSMARERLAEVAKGNDPSAQRRADREAPNVHELTDDYIQRHAIPNKRESSIRNDRQMIDRLITPKIGTMKVTEVTQRHIESLLHPLKKTPYQANRVRSLLSKMFGLSIEWKWRIDNPVQFVPKFHEEKRERWLDDDEVTRLMDALHSYPDKRAARAILLLVLTGARKSEVLKAEWTQFDLGRGIWTKPSHHVKQKKTHRVQLNGVTLALLVEMYEESSSESKFLFPGDVEDKPLTDIKRPWGHILNQACIEDVRIHDLRHTFASHLASSGMSLAIIGKLLGHTQAATTQRYAHLADDPLREASEHIGRKFEGLRNHAKAEVLPFTKRK